MGYLTNFIVYTLAMVGVVVLALFVFKTSTASGAKGKSKYLKVHDTLSLGPRKTLYIVSAGEEKFLIAGDVDKTSLISKLGMSAERAGQITSLMQKSEEEIVSNNLKEIPSFQKMMENIPKETSYIDRSSLGIYSTQNKPYKSVMKNLAKRIR